MSAPAPNPASGFTPAVPTAKVVRRVVGCMTGTSIDGIDAALVEIEGGGLGMKARFVRGHSAALGDLAAQLRALAEQQPMAAGAIAAIMHAFALLHAAVVRDLLAGESCDLVCVHGQTVFHKPPVSWQLFQPAPLARELKCPVVFDLRQADLAGGGQGAPITPIADWVLLRRKGDPMSVVNLGGFANYSQWWTDLGPEEEYPQAWNAKLDIRGGDICACNQLLDGLAREILDFPFDEDGRVAASGVRDDEAYEALLTVLAAQARGGRSLGTGDELAGWNARFAHQPGANRLRTACEAIAQTIVATTFGELSMPLVIAGGGARNAALVGALRDRSRGSVVQSDDLGLPTQFREAACFAVLGALCQDRVPITLPQVTGVGSPAPIAGAWVYPPA